MDEDTYNPNDPAFLVSRSLDDDLSAAEKRRLSDALERSAVLRIEAHELAVVDRLVKRWAEQPVELDWKQYAAGLETALRQEQEADDPALRKVDELLQKWGHLRANVDEEAFAAGVLTRIGARRRPAVLMQRVLRIGLPLAAAAAVAITVTTSMWFKPAPVAVVTIGGSPAAVKPLAGLPDKARMVVSFARPKDELMPEIQEPDISYLSLGSSPLPRGADEASPL